MKEAGGTYAENYGRAISFFLSLHYATEDDADLAVAVSLADDALDKLQKGGWITGLSAKPYYETADGVAYLLYALLELASYPRAMAPNL